MAKRFKKEEHKIKKENPIKEEVRITQVDDVALVYDVVNWCNAKNYKQDELEVMIEFALTVKLSRLGLNTEEIQTRTTAVISLTSLFVHERDNSYIDALLNIKDADEVLENIRKNHTKNWLETIDKNGVE